MNAAFPGHLLPENMTPNISAEALAHIRKESLDLYNRLHSIEEDISFVDSVRRAYPSQAFLREIQLFITDHCTLTASFFSSQFAMWCLVHRSNICTTLLEPSSNQR